MNDSPRPKLDPLYHSEPRRIQSAPNLPNSPLQLLSIPETARALGICIRTLSTIRASGDIQAIRIRGRVLYSIDELNRYIEARERGDE